MWEESLWTQAGVHLIEGVRLMWGPLNTGFTVLVFDWIAGSSQVITLGEREVVHAKAEF